jgi:hypothetical protein
MKARGRARNVRAFRHQACITHGGSFGRNRQFSAMSLEELAERTS